MPSPFNQPCTAMRLASLLFSFLLSVALAGSVGAQAIPDNDPGGMLSDKTVTEAGDVLDVDVDLQISHTWVGDLIVTLEHVDTGTTMTLMDRPGVPATTFGCSGDNVDATFDDGGANGPVENMCADLPAIFGNPQPDGDLSVFNGEAAAGTWRLRVSDNAGGDTGSLGVWSLTFTTNVANEPVTPEQMPDGYLLENAYPNPFNPSATIGFAVDETQAVRVTLHDALGRAVRTLYTGTVPAGTRQEAQIDGAGLPSGLYLVRMTGADFTATRRVTLLK